MLRELGLEVGADAMTLPYRSRPERYIPRHIFIFPDHADPSPLYAPPSPTIYTGPSSSTVHESAPPPSPASTFEDSPDGNDAPPPPPSYEASVYGTFSAPQYRLRESAAAMEEARADRAGEREPNLTRIAVFAFLAGAFLAIVVMGTVVCALL